ncbi:uncharacterized protein LOC134680860 isoform X2 [Mytilus trossulus]|uniref:uncharacterized protein LOC134680860 isoform X2 n=1 Tax=Mytilus trossulus TaxID=6551 RepID=UPI00300603F7
MIVKTAFILFGLLSYVKTWELRPPGYPAITYKGHTNSPITGHTVQLECSSAGGMPTPNITWYVDERLLTNSQNITVSPVTTTADVTSSTLTISHVTIGEHLQVFKCKVDNGVLQSDLVATFYIVAPPAPALTGKDTVLAGDTETWFCSSTAGFLEPKMTMYLNNVPIQSGFTVDKSAGGVIGTLIWTAQSMNDGDKLTCKIEHDLFDAKSTSVIVAVQATPDHPIFTGQTVFNPGQQQQWTCESKGGNPAPDMTITINNNQIYNGITSYEVKDYVTKTTEMTTTLNWAPSIANDGDSLCCKVTHVTLSYTQSSCLILQLAQVATQPPTISGSPLVYIGQSSQFSCTTLGGYQKPNMVMTIGGIDITSGISNQDTQDSNTQRWRVTQTVSMIATAFNDGQKICCEVPMLQPVCLTLSVQASLQQATISGPTSVISGQSTQWTCITKNGHPKPNMMMTMDGVRITNGFSSKEIQDSYTNTWTVTQYGMMAPTPINDGKKICCVVETLQPVCRTIAVQAPLQTPTIVGPSNVIIGQSTQWTCTSANGHPKPNMVMTLDGSIITNGFTSTEILDPNTNTWTVTQNVKMNPTALNAGQKICCQVPTLQPVCRTLLVQASLQTPTLVGPSQVTIGQSTQWTCTSTDGYPKPSMTMTLGGSTITNGLASTEYLNPNTNMWTVTKSVTMIPTAVNDGQRLCCQVSTQQPVCRTLAVQASVQTPTLVGPSQVTIGQSTQWTCTTDGYPKPSMIVTLGGSTITNGLTSTEYLNPNTNMWTVTHSVTLNPTALNDGQKICCQVPTLQPVCRTLAVQASVQTPTLVGPSQVTIGQSTQWTCTTDGYPKPSMTMTLGGSTITNGLTSTEYLNPNTNMWTVTHSVSLNPTALNDGQKLCCQVPTLQPVCRTLAVQVAPQPPIMLGPSTVITGQQSQWTCTSSGGNPKPTMVIKLNGVIQSGTYPYETQNTARKTWTISQTFTMIPTALNNGQSICCEVYHVALTTTQSTCRTIAVQGTDSLCQGPATVTFALDGSDSISNDNYQTMIDFTINNINSFNLGQNYIMVGALVYGSDVTAINPMGNKANLIQEIQSRLIQPRDGTQTHKALETIRLQMVNLPSTRSRVAIFITDGESYDKVQTEIQANLAKQQGVLIAAFGIDMKPGTGGYNELNTIASSPDLVFLFDSFNSLITNITMIKDILCQVITPSTTTTPAPLTTTLKTEPIVTDPLCEGCVIVDGHAYVAHDSDCSKFYHCYLTHDTNGDEIMVAKEENCAAKTFWSQEHKTCVTWENMVCPNPLNKCFGQVDGTLMPYLGCETYWMCQGGIPLPMACSNNRIFDPNTLQCIPDPGTTSCFGPTLQTCNFEEDPADASKYFVKQQAQDGSVIMIHQTCASGTLYDQSKCSCSTHDTNIVILPTGCQALVEQGQNGVFTFKQTSELIYGINSNALVDFQTDPDAMKLTPNGHIIMYRLANYDFQQAFAVSFKLQLSASSPSGLQQILINCIYPDTATSLIDTPSISIQVGKSPTGDYTFFSQLQTTDGMQIINVSITGSTSAYVDVTMAYDGNVFVLNVDGQESSIAMTGSILKGPTFALGRPLTQPTANGIQYLDGSIKNLKIYDCIAQEIKDKLNAM